MKTKARISDKYGDSKTVTLYSDFALGGVANTAFVFLEKWSLVAAIPDGEDSAGRAKLRLPTPDEVVTRAFDIAERAWAEAQARGHLVAVPDLNEINARADAKERKREEEEDAREAARQAAKTA